MTEAFFVLIGKIMLFIKRKRAAFRILGAVLSLALLAEIAAGMASWHEAASTGILKWVDFKVTAEAMKDALAYDAASHGGENEIHWIDLLACLGADLCRLCQHPKRTVWGKVEGITLFFHASATSEWCLYTKDCLHILGCRGAERTRKHKDASPWLNTDSRCQASAR